MLNTHNLTNFNIIRHINADVHSTNTAAAVSGSGNWVQKKINA